MASPRLPRAAAAASDGEALAAARDVLRRGHAVDAVVAGVFAACALAPSVLLGPVQLLVGGAGTGLHAIDGRVQQPGKGLPRPRGFQPDEAIPDAARVGAPALPAALSTALASFGGSSLSNVLGPAIEMARRASRPRRELLLRVAERGPLALTDARVAEHLVRVAGRGQGGLLSERDLEELRPAVARAERTRLEGGRLATVPWGGVGVRGLARIPGDVPDVLAASPGSAVTRIVAAVDGRARFAIACYEVAPRGLAIEALDLVAPFFASPVLRGRTRVPPAFPCLSPAPIALVEEEGALTLAAGLGGEDEAEAELGRWLAAFDGTKIDRVVPGLVALALQRRGVQTLAAG
jgi:Gamma-glutamyltranspeptidase